MEEEKTLEQLYQEKFGINEEVRNARLEELKTELGQVVVDDNFSIVGTPDEIGKRQVLINARVKSLDRIKEKVHYNKWEINDVYDAWGLEIVVADDEDLEDIVGAVKYFYLDFPQEEDLIRSDGTMLPLQFHSGKDSSMATHADYSAETVCKKSQYGIVQVRVIKKDIYLRTQDPNNPLHHDNYKKRQQELYNTLSGGEES